MGSGGTCTCGSFAFLLAPQIDNDGNSRKP